MKKRILVSIYAIALVVGAARLGLWVSQSPDFGLTILIALIPVAICIWFILKDKTDRSFLLRVFILALILRWVIALLINWKNLQMFFGPDAQTFDSVGWAISDVWKGILPANSLFMEDYTTHGRPGWGMFYYVAAIYYLIGRDQLLIQLINCAFGAASCITVYKVAQHLYPQVRVARTAAFLTAISPSMILWSAQLMKDGPIVLSLGLCALYTLKLQEKLSVKNVLVLLISLLCLFSLRNYAFYIMFGGVSVALLLSGKRFTPVRLIQGSLVILIVGGALAYLGAGGDVNKDTFNLEKIQAGRVWSAKVANSGFGGDVDITDPQAALGFLPIGLVYVLFAPFPWMITNLRQLITLPELIVWWLLVPMVVRGFWYAVRHRLKQSFAMVVFTVGLTLTYALFQSNVGTAYRHRAQLYVFFFIFIGIGLDLRRQAKLQKRSRVSFASPYFTPGLQGSPAMLAHRPITPRVQNTP